MGATEDAASRRPAPHRDISAPHVEGSQSPEGSGEAGATWALLVAAGAGERLELDRPKAFAELRGRPLLAESLERLDLCPWVDAIVVAAPPGWEEPVILLSEELAASKVVSCVTGGATRAESVRAALADVDEGAIVVLVHDAARPLLRDGVVERVLGPLAEGFDGVVPALPVPDTLKRVDLMGAQTPQAFLAPALRRAFAGDVSEATDCASLVERAGGRIAVVDGDPMLFKVTTSADLALVEALLAPA
jgi:2-C-methyl-D-erythritol 4-phosphate cytidylyltransferase